MSVIIFIAAVILLTNPCHSAAVEQSALDHYQKAYQRAPQNYIHNYNLGTYYLENDQIGYAITYLEKAVQLSPRDRDIRHNLRLAKAKVVDPLNNKPGLLDLAKAFVSLITAHEWLLLLTGSQAIFILLKKLGKHFPNMQLALLILCAIPTSAAVMISLNQEAVVVIPKADLKQSPSHVVDTSFQAHEGVKAKILEEHLDWVKIKCQNGITGWVEKKALKKI